MINKTSLILSGLFGIGLAVWQLAAAGMLGAVYPAVWVALAILAGMALGAGLTLPTATEQPKKTWSSFSPSLSGPALSGPAPADPGATPDGTYSVTLVTTGESKIYVIKVVREVTGLGLAEAKNLVESTPRVVKERLSRQEAEAIQASFVAAGAQVSIDRSA